ncbi:MAG TPA: hypothetical protein VFT42_00835, partial [Solirubrobacteraceae bacterium]|nr:hypothetical protein [Solirubrobacteraceae bacterium]
MAGPLDRAPQSRRVAAALALAQTRREQRRAQLRPLAWALVTIAVAAIVSGEPAPSTSGRSAGVLAALCVYVLLVALTIRSGRLDRERRLQAGAVVALGLVAVALAALQTKGATELPAATAVWLAVSRMPDRTGAALAVAIGAGASIAGALAGSSVAGIAAALLLYALLGLMA